MKTTKKCPPDNTKVCIVRWSNGKPFLGVGLVKSAMIGKRVPRRVAWVEFNGKEVDYSPENFPVTPKQAIEQELAGLFSQYASNSPEERLLQAIFGHGAPNVFRGARQIGKVYSLWRRWKSKSEWARSAKHD